MLRKIASWLKHPFMKSRSPACEEGEKSVVRAEINRILNNAGNGIPHLYKYHRKLIPPVRHAMNYIAETVEKIPGPVDLNPCLWDRDPTLNAMFVAPGRLETLVDESRAVQRLLQHSQHGVYALLSAAWKEKSFAGPKRDGAVLQRDVLQTAVSFEDHRLSVPAPELSQARQQLQQDMLDRLFARAAREIDELESWRRELQSQKEYLAFQRTHAAAASEPSDGDAGRKPEIADLEKRLQDKLCEINSRLESPEDYLNFVSQFLTAPESVLQIQTVFLRLSRLGVKLSTGASERSNDFSVAQVKTDAGLRQAAVWVRIEKNPVS